MPRTRAEAASELGISRRSAARLERTGLRELHVACGGSTAVTGTGSGGGRSGAVNARFARLASHAPDLEPAEYLPMSSAPDLHRSPRGQGDVKGVTQTVTPQADATAKVATAAIDESHGLLWALVVAAGLAALGALALVTTRRRAEEAPLPELIAFTPPPPAPAPQPVEQRKPEPVALARPAPRPESPSANAKLVRSASVVASAAASFAVRELVRRRRRR